METTLRFDAQLMRDDMAERGWRLAHLAQASGLHYETAARTLRQQTFNPTTIARLARALGRGPKRYLRRAQ